MLDDRDVMRLFLRDQPGQVRPHRMEGIGGDHRAVQVQGPQELGEVAGLVVLHADLEVIQEGSAVLGGVPAPINSAIPAYYSHPGQNGVTREHAGALGSSRRRLSAYPLTRFPSTYPRSSLACLCMLR